VPSKSLNHTRSKVFELDGAAVPVLEQEVNALVGIAEQLDQALGVVLAYVHVGSRPLAIWRRYAAQRQVNDLGILVDADSHMAICNQSKILEILEKFPFLTYGVMHDDEYLGIVQNADNQFVSMYIIDLIPSEDQRKLFMEFGDRWWWESNRKVPINVFIKDQRFKQFRTCACACSAPRISR
jgi:hypothetical protein